MQDFESITSISLRLVISAGRKDPLVDSTGLADEAVGLVYAGELVVGEGRKLGGQPLGLDLVGVEGGAFLAVGGFHFGTSGGFWNIEGVVGFVEGEGGPVGIVGGRGVTTLHPRLDRAMREVQAFLSPQEYAGLQFAHLAVLGSCHLE